MDAAAAAASERPGPPGAPAGPGRAVGPRHAGGDGNANANANAGKPKPKPGSAAGSAAGRASAGRDERGGAAGKLELVSTRQGRVTIRPLAEQLSFDKGFFLFIRALQLLTQANANTNASGAAAGNVVVVGLAGPSGAGKTIFTSKVKNFFPGCEVISMDMYNDARKLVDENFDDPALTDYDLLCQNLTDIKAGKPVDIPVYSFKESKRVGYRRAEPPASRVVILEGIYALSERLRPFHDLRVSVTGGVHFDLVKRVLRDIKRAGQAPEEIVQQITETVYPMYKAFIEPDLQTAHLKIYNTFNPFAGFSEPTYTLKSSVALDEGEIASVLPSLKKKKESPEYYDIYLLPPQEDPETCNTWIRMRNRAGKYMLMFEEWVTDGPFILSPGVKFEVSVKILGGLMALGYDIFVILKRKSISYLDPDRPNDLVIKIDQIEGFDQEFVQIQGTNRTEVAAAASMLGMDGSYIPQPYIEQVQMQQLTSEFLRMTNEMKSSMIEKSSRSSSIDGGPGGLFSPPFLNSPAPSGPPAPRQAAVGPTVTASVYDEDRTQAKYGSAGKKARSYPSFDQAAAGGTVTASVYDADAGPPAKFGAVGKKAHPFGAGNGGPAAGHAPSSEIEWLSSKVNELINNVSELHRKGGAGKAADLRATLAELVEGQQHLARQVNHLEKVIKLVALSSKAQAARPSEGSESTSYVLLAAGLGMAVTAVAVVFQARRTS